MRCEMFHKLTRTSFYATGPQFVFQEEGFYLKGPLASRPGDHPEGTTRLLQGKIIFPGEGESGAGATVRYLNQKSKKRFSPTIRVCVMAITAMTMTPSAQSSA